MRTRADQTAPPRDTYHILTDETAFYNLRTSVSIDKLPNLALTRSMVNGPEDTENKGADILPFRRRDSKQPTVRFVDNSDADQATLQSEESMRALLEYQDITDPKEQDEIIARLMKDKPPRSNVTPLDDTSYRDRPVSDLSDVPEF